MPYTIEIAKACLDLNINWWEECLSPDDSDGFKQIKRAHPTLKFTTGEHEYSRYGFRKLIEGRNLDIIQPDVMWLGGMTELLKVAAMAAAYDIPVVPHASGPYSYHFVMSQPNTPFQEYLANSADGKSVLPVFGDLFLDEPIPTKGFLTAADLDKPGFGLTINPAAKARLIPAEYLLVRRWPSRRAARPRTRRRCRARRRWSPACRVARCEEGKEGSEGAASGGRGHPVQHRRGPSKQCSIAPRPVTRLARPTLLTFLPAGRPALALWHLGCGAGGARWRGNQQRCAVLI